MESSIVPVDQLEELFEQDVMCDGLAGGHGCPHHNPAALVRADGCRCRPYRCVPCYTRWIQRCVSRQTQEWLCSRCGHLWCTMPIYVPI